MSRPGCRRPRQCRQRHCRARRRLLILVFQVPPRCARHMCYMIAAMCGLEFIARLLHSLLQQLCLSAIPQDNPPVFFGLLPSRRRRPRVGMPKRRNKFNGENTDKRLASWREDAMKYCWPSRQRRIRRFMRGNRGRWLYGQKGRMRPGDNRPIRQSTLDSWPRWKCESLSNRI